MPLLLSYPHPDLYDPVRDPSLAPEEQGKAFLRWVSGYYAHGDTLETLAQRDTLSDPRPSIENMSPDDLIQNLYAEGARPDHMDLIVLQSGHQQGTFERNRVAALSPSQATASDREWGEIEFKFIWGERSAWLFVWGAWEFKADMAKNAKEGKDSEKKQTRKTSMVCIPGGNHFVSACMALRPRVHS